MGCLSKAKMRSPVPTVTAARSPQRLRDLPGPRGLPLLGNAGQIDNQKMHRQLEDWSQRYGERFQISLGTRRILVCSNPDDIAAVLKDRPSGFRRTTRLETLSSELGIGGLFSANGDEWRRQRTFVMHAFNPAHVKSYFPSLQLVATRFLRRWQQHALAGVPFELEPDLMRYTVDVTAGLAFGTDVNTIESDGVVIQTHLATMFRMLQKRLFAPFRTWRWLRRREDRALVESVKYVMAAVHGFIAAARQRMEHQPMLFAQPSNLLEAMIAARDENAAALSESALTGNILTMLLAGEDTTAHTLAWIIHELARNPTLFAQVRTEADRVLGSDALPQHHAQLGELDFIEACIHESMRLRPVAPMIGAEANAECVVAGVTVPKGTVILMPVRVGAVAESNFKDPMRFDPQRWLQPSGPGNLRKAAMPFGTGPRLCPGRFLAIEEMKMVIALLARNFDLEAITTPDGLPVQERLNFTMAPVGLQLTLRARPQ